MTKSSQPISPVAILIPIAIAILFLRSLPESSAPGPLPTPDNVPIAKSIEDETVEMMRRTSEGYRRVFADAAKEIGTAIKTEEQLLRFLAEKTKSVREEAKSGFDIVFEREMPFQGEIPEEKYDQARSVLERISKAFPRIK